MSWENRKKTKWFVETPQILVDIMHFYLALDENKTLADFTAWRGILFKNHPPCKCFGIEIDEVNFTFLKNKWFENVIFGDFFENIEKMPEVDCLIFNPPYFKNSNEFIFKALQKLKKNGRFAIISKDTTFKNFWKEYEDFVKNNLNIEMCWKLDTNLFKPFATVKTILIFWIFWQKQSSNFEIQEFSNEEIIVNTRAKIIEPKILHPKKIIVWENNDFWGKLNELEMIDITPKFEDFLNTVTEYIAWETGFPVEFLRNPKKFGEALAKLRSYWKKV